MTKEFINRVLYYGPIDTRKYRYLSVFRHDHEQQWFEIRRLPLDYLGTTLSINGWETVYSSRK